MFSVSQRSSQRFGRQGRCLLSPQTAPLPLQEVFSRAARRDHIRRAGTDIAAHPERLSVLPSAAGMPETRLAWEPLATPRQLTSLLSLLPLFAPTSGRSLAPSPVLTTSAPPKSCELSSPVRAPPSGPALSVRPSGSSGRSRSCSQPRQLPAGVAQAPPRGVPLGCPPPRPHLQARVQPCEPFPWGGPCKMPRGLVSYTHTSPPPAQEDTGMLHVGWPLAGIDAVPFCGIYLPAVHPIPLF